MNMAVVATSAGLLGMLPKGLVLLISIGLAVGVIPAVEEKCIGAGFAFSGKFCPL